ncbi:polysaccharide lyase family 1 protein [Pontibacter silvestris]|uniref:Polysaccharide lyase family 1 protein n=1 Tax=Pontibacter silvestris TaxID=2305183 RepID=A0ABW4WUQ2_9BACT|nr:pectate lyase [Pontibacter silvestris]MCC9137254.1 pectate lyase [Pontibacter silvestris]
MNKKIKSLLFSASLLVSLVSCTVAADTDEPVTGSTVKDISPDIEPEGNVIAFPGAEGFGKATTGGRGGKVYIVTNLNDSGAGSLREAVSASGARTIVFAVSGTIALKSQLNISNSNLTIAGQSAPGDGICVRNYPVVVDADNVVIRYIRFRMGDTKAVEGDALGGRKRKSIVIDHCSISWATDEVTSFYDNENFTMQWCLIAESLNESVHVKGAHGYGGIWGGMGATFHHNLLAHHNSRNPRFNGSRYHKQPAKEVVDFRNNVIYNWAGNSSYGGEEGNQNMVNNYYKPGPATPAVRTSRIVNPSSPYGKFYVAGNYVAGDATVTKDNWRGGVQGAPADEVKAAQPFNVLAVPEQVATAAYEQVLDNAGASLHRDAVDERIVADVRAGTGNKGKNSNGIIDSQEDVGGWPELNSEPAPADADQDGIPDEWEKQNNLNPSKAADAQYYKKGTPFTYLETYLNSLID